jgi:uncharacterized protein YoxC
MNHETFLLLSFIVVAVLTVFLVPILMEIKRLLASVTGLIKTADDSLKPLMAEITDTVRKANGIVGTVNDIVKNVNDLVDSFKGLAAGAKELGTTFKESVTFISTLKGQLTGFISTLVTTLGLLAKGVTKKGGSENVG